MIQPYMFCFGFVVKRKTHVIEGPSCFHITNCSLCILLTLEQGIKLNSSLIMFHPRALASALYTWSEATPSSPMIFKNFSLQVTASISHEFFTCCTQEPNSKCFLNFVKPTFTAWKSFFLSNFAFPLIISPEISICLLHSWRNQSISSTYRNLPSFNIFLTLFLVCIVFLKF